MENQSTIEEDPGTKVEKTRIGEQYQTQIPNLIADRALIPNERATLLWSPIIEDDEANLEEYIFKAEMEHDYSEEQALSMLCWHKNIEKARNDLPNYTPINHVYWTEMDEWLFEEGCIEFENDFAIIQERKLPRKSIGELIDYYYKKLREDSPKRRIKKTYSLRSRN